MPIFNSCPNFIKRYYKAGLENNLPELNRLSTLGIPFFYYNQRGELVSAAYACLADQHINAAINLIKLSLYDFKDDPSLLMHTAWEHKQYEFILWALEQKEHWLSFLIEDHNRALEFANYIQNTGFELRLKFYSIMDSNWEFTTAEDPSFHAAIYNELRIEEVLNTSTSLTPIIYNSVISTSSASASNTSALPKVKRKPARQNVDDDNDDDNNNSAVSSTSREVSREKRTRNRDEVAHHVARTMHIHTKYLGEEAMPKLKMLKDAKAMEEGHTWSNYPVPELQNLFLDVYQDEIQFEGWGSMTHYHAAERAIQPDDRVTIIFAARSLNGKYPDETQNGRVILLMTSSELGEDKEFQPQVLHQLITPNRDVCIIESLSMLEKEGESSIQKNIPKDEIGLIMSRRVAGFFLAKHLNLKNVIFADDNIERYSIKYADGVRRIVMKDVYEYMSSQAVLQNAVAVSPRSWRPELTTESDSDSQFSTSEQLEDSLGSKVFFIRFDMLSEKFPTYRQLSTLLTHHRRMWGSDIFFQFMLMLKFTTVVLDHSQMLIDRAGDHKHMALKSVHPAKDWLRMKEEQFVNLEQEKVCRFIQEGVRRNIDRIQKAMNTLSLLDLKKFQADKSKTAYVDQQRLARLPLLNGTIAPANFQYMEELFASAPVDKQFQPYQKSAIKALLEAVGTSGSLEAPARSGKTVMFLSAISTLIRNRDQWRGHIILVTPQIVLVNQLLESVKQHIATFPGSSLRVDDFIKISSGENDISVRLVAMNQLLKREPAILIFCAVSLRKMLEGEGIELLDRTAMIFVDEAHKVHYDLNTKIVAEAKARRISAFAISATTNSIVELYEMRIFSLPIADAKKFGVICPFTLDAFPAPYSPENVERIVREMPQFLNTTYHPSGPLFRYTKNLIFVSNTKIAAELRDTLRAQGLESVCINYDATPSTHEKKAALTLFENRQSNTNVLILVGMMTLGITINCDSVIYLKKSSQKVDLDADHVYQAGARCLNYQSFDEEEAELLQNRVAAIIGWSDANMKQLRGHQCTSADLQENDYIRQKRAVRTEFHRLIDFPTQAVEPAQKTGARFKQRLAEQDAYASLPTFTLGGPRSSTSTPSPRGTITRPFFQPFSSSSTTQRPASAPGNNSGLGNK